MTGRASCRPRARAGGRRWALRCATLVALSGGALILPRVAGVGAAALTARPMAFGADLVLNELLYDPLGADAGAEFVELYNPTDQTLPLNGCAFVFINGADPEHQAVVWTAPSGASVAAHEFFVVGGALVDRADARADLGLQNGPDALWLLRGPAALDRVAYGTVAGIGEGDPARDVSGASLGRVPDGADSDDNARDLVALDVPSPGAPNAAETRLLPLTWRADPPWRAGVGLVRVQSAWRAEGYGHAQRSALNWMLDGRLVASDTLALARGDSATAQHDLWLEAGAHHVVVIASPASAAATAVAGAPPESLSIPLHVGLAEVALSELMPAPQPGEPEWIELVCLADSVDLSDWAVADGARATRAVADPGRLQRGQFALLTADPAALRTLFALPSAVPCSAVQGGWPSLNNSPSTTSGIADEVLLFDPHGAVVDYVAYGSDLVRGAGRSVERGLFGGDAPAPWFAAPGSPTPGRENRAAAAPPPQSGLLVTPNPFTPDDDGEADVLHVLLRLDGSAAPLDAEVLDLTGERVRTLGSDAGGGTLRQWLWDGRDGAGRAAPVGAYVVAVRESGDPREALGSGSADSAGATWRALVVLGRRR